MMLQIRRIFDLLFPPGSMRRRALAHSTAALAVVLLVVSTAEAQRHRNWKTSHSVSRASGDNVCFVNSRASAFAIVTGQKGDGAKHLIAFIGTDNRPGAPAYLAVGEQRWTTRSARPMLPESDTTEVVRLFLSGQHEVAHIEWSSYARASVEQSVRIDGFRQAYEECLDLVGFDREVYLDALLPTPARAESSSP